MLLDFCQRENVPYDLCGKIVVATSEEQKPLLANLYQRGLQNGLTQNRMISAAEIREIEPHVKGLEGIWVPYTGIIDYKAVSEKYAECIQKLGGEIRFGEKIIDIKNRNTIQKWFQPQANYSKQVWLSTAPVYILTK
jgi:L-2-hydroxyglutarate oxidase